MREHEQRARFEAWWDSNPPIRAVQPDGTCDTWDKAVARAAFYTGEREAMERAAVALSTASDFSSKREESRVLLEAAGMIRAMIGGGDGP